MSTTPIGGALIYSYNAAAAAAATCWAADAD